jgi:transcriptional regulator with PAS, ATPase and Fis domain
MSHFEHGFLQALFASDDIGLGLVDTDLRYVMVNDKLAAINGLPAERHLGRPVREVLPAFADPIEAMLRSVIETREPLVDFSLQGLPTDPSADRHFLGTYSPLVHGDSVIGVGALLVEMTERVRSERALMEHARSVYENVVQDLTVAQLAMEQDDDDQAYEAVQRAMKVAKRVASMVLMDSFVKDE